MFSFLIILVLIIIIFIIIISKSYSSSSDSNNHSEEYYIPSNISETKYRPKISAEISDSLYAEVRSYCRKKSITISDLIRKSVKDYMDQNN